jgi:hypothetical protein
VHKMLEVEKEERIVREEAVEGEAHSESAKK